MGLWVSPSRICRKKESEKRVVGRQLAIRFEIEIELQRAEGQSRIDALARHEVMGCNDEVAERKKMGRRSQLLGINLDNGGHR